MEEEARQFATNIRLMEKDIRGLKLADETFMNTCKQVLASDLPRVYDFGDDGHVHAVGPLDTIGRGCKVEDLERVQQELSQGLEQDVLTPMKQWLFAWSTVQARLKELEDMRIEVDSRKRQVFNIRQKEVKLKEKLDNAKTDHQKKIREKNLEDSWRMQQRKASTKSLLSLSSPFVKTLQETDKTLVVVGKLGCEIGKCYGYLPIDGVRSAGGACGLDPRCFLP